jgi:6-phosphofructokinase 1
MAAANDNHVEMLWVKHGGHPDGGQVTRAASPVRASKGLILPMHAKCCSVRHAGKIQRTSEAQFIILFPHLKEQPMASGKILVAQGGGPTAVINQSLVGVALEARRFSQIGHIYGAHHGVRGIIDEDFVDLTQETSHNLELVANTPSSALGSTRDKPDAAYCHEIFKVLQAHQIGHFFYIGGNDSSDTVRIVSQEAQAANYDLRCIHIPKTIDNDLVGNDHTPGFPSAARFVAQAFAGANLDNAALPGVYVGVVMGRHAGFLTAASALGKKFPDDGPHLIYLPERTFDLNQFLLDVKTMYERHGRCVIAVSEGIHDASGTPITALLAKDLEHDAHGNVQLSGNGALADLLCEEIKAKLKIKRVRGDTFGYLQRSFIGCVSDVDQREAREVGEKAVQFAMWGGRDGSVAIKRTGFYSVDYELLPLEAVAGKTRVMEDEFITASGTDVTDAFRMYLRPLLGSGMPDAFRLRHHPVARVLNK